MVANDTKIYLKMKNKTKPLLFIEKYGKKSLIIIIRNYNFFKKCLFKKSYFAEEYQDASKKPILML